VTPRDIVVGDIGGTHARFAIACLGGGVPVLRDVVSLPAHDYPDLAAALRCYGERLGRPLPEAAAFAVAGPVRGATISFTNSPWRIARDGLAEALGLERVLLINDFGAVGHAVAVLPEGDFARVCGPEGPLPTHGAISIVGPGTGLGVAIVLRGAAGAQVIETEGGHTAFAPLDAFEQALHARLLRRHGRVSNERVVCGAGLVAIHEALRAEEGQKAAPLADADLWAAALGGDDPHARAALDRFCLSYGAVVGDLALAHGAAGVVLVGSLTQRMIAPLRASGFAARFTAKGRHSGYMGAIPVRLATHPQPGLLGAAAAFAAAA